ncbi:PorV/PorQ family protein [Elusimicrobiota bacterium]
MKKIFTAIFLIPILLAPLNAAFSKDDAGTSAAPFLKLGAGARAAAMGDAYVAVVNNADGVYWNPAALYDIEEFSFSAMHAVWFEDIYYDWISYARNITFGTIGIGAQYLSYGTMKKTDSTGAEISDFSPSDLAITLSYANYIFGIPMGISAKYVSLTIEDSATAFAMDIGTKLSSEYNEFAFGFVIQNIGTKVKFINEEDPLPLNIKTGIAYRASSTLLFSLDANAPIDNEPNAGIGIEYSKEINFDTYTAIRAGYNTKTKDISGLQGFSAGIGFRYFEYDFDYAYVPFGDLGQTHKISFSLKF